MRRRHGAQRVRVAEGEDHRVQLHEAAAAAPVAPNAAAEHAAAAQQLDAPQHALTTNAIEPQPVVELTNQYNSQSGDEQQHARH